jgi:hypothetical protein
VYYCGKLFLPENALLRTINKYSLTTEGARAAIEATLPVPGLVIFLWRRQVFIDLRSLKSFINKRLGD